MAASCYINKLSLVGMQLPEKYKENFDVSSEGPSSGVSSQTFCGKLYFSSHIPNDICFIAKLFSTLNDS